MKRILFITPYSPESRIVGDMIYTWDILRALRADSNNYIHLVAYNDSERKYEGQAEKLTQLVDRITLIPFHHLQPWQMSLSYYPASMANRANGHMRIHLQKILQSEQFDVVFFNMLKMTFLARQLNFGNAKRIYISHNIESEVSRSIVNATPSLLSKLIYGIDFLKTTFWEKHILPYFDAITTICSYDAKQIKNMGFTREISIIRPIIDLNETIPNREHTSKIIICGSFTWLPKQINLQNILNANSISHLAPNHCHLQVVGRSLPSEIRLGNSLPGVTITGAVDSTEPYYQDAEVAIVPELAGGGFKLKIAEAVLHHIPIVAIRGAISDDDMVAGVHYLEANDFNSLIDSAIDLVGNPVLQNTLIKNAHLLFKTKYCLDAVQHELNQIIQNDF